MALAPKQKVQESGPAGKGTHEPVGTSSMVGRLMDYATGKSALQPKAPAAKSPMADPTHNPDPTNEYAPSASYGTVRGVVAAKGEGDAHEIDASDAKQGALGDCYFIAQLAAQARTNPERIKNLIKDNGDGTYTVTLHLKGSMPFARRVPTPIVVDSQFPQKDGSTAYAKPGDSGAGGPELWVMLIEKAWAKYNGSYEKIRGKKTPDADVFGMMSGTNSDSVSMRQGGDKILEQMSRALSRNRGVTVGAISSNDEKVQNEAKAAGVVLNHAYTVMGVDLNAKTVDLRNPWGVKHLTGFKVEDLKKYFDDCRVAGA